MRQFWPSNAAGCAPAAQRSTAIGVYRMWRDAGNAASAIVAGVVADIAGVGTAIAAVAVLTACSGAARLDQNAEP